VKQQQITYIAEIVAELERIAIKAGCQRLATILRFAHAEARRQRDGAKDHPPA